MSTFGRRDSRRFFLYNTVCEIFLSEYDGDPSSILDECEAVAHEVRQRLDSYDEGSELGRLNSGLALGRPHPVSGPLFSFLTALDRFSRMSGGAFDATVGPVVRLWDFTANRPAVPPEEEIRAALLSSGYEKLSYRSGDNTVVPECTGLRLDPGGAGKGYAVGLVARRLREMGVRSASVNFGGNLCVLGRRAPTEGEPRPWRVGVRRPWGRGGETVGYLLLADRAVATSGAYERYFEKDGRIYHHIIDPRTGFPAHSGIESATIVSGCPLLTDLMSTAFYVLGLEEGGALARRVGRETGLEVEYIAVEQGRLAVSDGLSGCFHPQPGLEMAIHRVQNERSV